MVDFLTHTDASIAEISKHALIHNFEFLSQRAGTKAQMLPMVKTNAYGHGVDIVLSILSELPIAGVGVASFHEALEVRALGFEKTIVVFGRLNQAMLHEAKQKDITLTVHSKYDVITLASHQGSLPDFHVEFETGMHRLGIEEKELGALISEHENIFKQTKGVFTHFAESEDQGSSFTQKQQERFVSMTQALKQCADAKLVLHASNSGSVLLQSVDMLDWIRPGIALYGYDPGANAKRWLKPVMTWKAPIVQIQKLPKGETVGYNRTFKADEDITIATVGIGYGDGFARKYRSVGVGYQGKRLPIVGNICMDLMMIDISSCPNACIGDPVWILGPGKNGEPTADELAKVDQTISYEVVGRVSSRVTRVEMA